MTELALLRVNKKLLQRALKVIAGRTSLANNVSADHLVDDILRRIASLPDRWVCDVCGQFIEGHRDGQLEWLWDGCRAWGLQLVHTANASPGPLMHVVTDDEPPQNSCGHKNPTSGRQLLKIPLSHLTDDDGLLQLLEHVAKGLLPREQVLELIQRIHMPFFEMARPLLDKAVSRGLIKPNLSAGFHWQGDLVETLKFLAPETAETDTQGC